MWPLSSRDLVVSASGSETCPPVGDDGRDEDRDGVAGGK
jgi:hypothetical protein